MMKDSIDILMATYNGARYIEPQIYSILSQSFSNWRLLVHDDGSIDDTTIILRRFSQKDDRIILIEDGVTGLGPGRNFLHLLQYSSADFICFADQDDFWFKNKLSQMLYRIKNVDCTQPQVVYTNGTVWRSDSNDLCGRVNHVTFNTYKELLFYNGGYQGASAIFNRKMLELISKDYEHVAMHDQILNLAGIMTRGIHYYKDNLFLYRQHTSNVTTHIQPSYLKRLYYGTFRKNLRVLERSYFDGIRAFHKAHKGDFIVEDAKVISLFISYPEKKPYKRFLSVLANGFSHRGSVLLLMMKIIIRKFI